MSRSGWSLQPEDEAALDRLRDAISCEDFCLERQPRSSLRRVWLIQPPSPASPGSAASVSCTMRSGSHPVVLSAPFPKVDAGATYSDLLGNFSDRQTTLDPCVAKEA